LDLIRFMLQTKVSLLHLSQPRVLKKF